jgi:hypothetical protein
MSGAAPLGALPTGGGVVLSSCEPCSAAAARLDTAACRRHFWPSAERQRQKRPAVRPGANVRVSPVWDGRRRQLNERVCPIASWRSLDRARRMRTRPAGFRSWSNLPNKRLLVWSPRLDRPRSRCGADGRGRTTHKARRRRSSGGRRRGARRGRRPLASRLAPAWRPNHTKSGGRPVWCPACVRVLLFCHCPRVAGARGDSFGGGDHASRRRDTADSPVRPLWPLANTKRSIKFNQRTQSAGFVNRVARGATIAATRRRQIELIVKKCFQRRASMCACDVAPPACRPAGWRFCCAAAADDDDKKEARRGPSAGGCCVNARPLVGAARETLGRLGRRGCCRYFAFVTKRLACCCGWPAATAADRGRYKKSHTHAGGRAQ